MVQIERRNPDVLGETWRALGLACELRKTMLHTAAPCRRESLSFHEASVLRSKMMLQNVNVIVLHVSLVWDVLQLRKHYSSADGMILTGYYL